MSDEWTNEEGATEIAELCVSAFARLYPKLSLPLEVWETLREMISQEVMAHADLESTYGAMTIATNPLYIAAAAASCLR